MLIFIYKDMYIFIKMTDLNNVVNTIISNIQRRIEYHFDEVNKCKLDLMIYNFLNMMIQDNHGAIILNSGKISQFLTEHNLINIISSGQLQFPATPNGSDWDFDLTAGTNKILIDNTETTIDQTPYDIFFRYFDDFYSCWENNNNIINVPIMVVNVNMEQLEKYLLHISSNMPSDSQSIIDELHTLFNNVITQIQNIQDE